VIGDLKTKKKRKKQTSKKPAFRSQPQPYQIPLYTPPFPVTIPRNREDNNVKVGNMLRNYIGVQKKELARLRGDLTAYRQEAQSNMKQKVAYPKSGVDLGKVSDPDKDFEEEVKSDISDTTSELSSYQSSSDLYQSSSDFSTLTTATILPESLADNTVVSEVIPTFNTPIKNTVGYMAVDFGAEPPPAPIALIPEPEKPSRDAPLVQREIPPTPIKDAPKPPPPKKPTRSAPLVERQMPDKPTKPAPLPLKKMTLLDPPSRTALTLDQVENIEATKALQTKPADLLREPDPIRREPDFTQKFEKPQPPTRKGRGGSRAGAGRKERGLASASELAKRIRQSGLIPPDEIKIADDKTVVGRTANLRALAIKYDISVTK